MYTTRFSGHLFGTHPLANMPPHHTCPPTMHASLCHACPPYHICPPPLPHTPPFTTQSPPPSVDRRNDTRLWKHYLPATTVADGNESQKLNQAKGTWTQTRCLAISLFKLNRNNCKVTFTFSDAKYHRKKCCYCDKYLLLFV